MRDRSGEPAPVPHEQPPAELVRLAPRLDAVRSQDDELVAGEASRVPVGLAGIRSAECLILADPDGALDDGVDDDDVSGRTHPEPRLPVDARFVAVGDDSSTAMTARSVTHASDSGTRYGVPAGDAVDTQTSTAGSLSLVSASALLVARSRGCGMFTLMPPR